MADEGKMEEPEFCSWCEALIKNFPEGKHLCANCYEEYKFNKIVPPSDEEINKARDRFTCDVCGGCKVCDSCTCDL